MNKRIKKKRKKAYDWSTKKERLRNRQKCKRYPFLISRSWSTGKMIYLRKPYDLIEEIEKGWDIAFGDFLWEDIRNELIKFNYLNKVRFLEIKEKFGELRIYTNDIPPGCNVWNIIDDYSYLSRHICYKCGKPDVPITDTGWILPICKECFVKIEIQRNKYRLTPLAIEEIINKYHYFEQNGCEMSTERIMNIYSNGGTKTVIYDLTEKVEKIRAKWRKNEQKKD